MMKLALVLLLLSAACAAAEPPAVVLVGATGNLVRHIPVQLEPQGVPSPPM